MHAKRRDHSGLLKRIDYGHMRSASTEATSAIAAFGHDESQMMAA